MDITDLKRRHKFLIRSYNGGNLLKNYHTQEVVSSFDDSYFVRYYNECKEKYNARVQRSAIYNYLKPIVKSMYEPIYIKEIQRDFRDPILKLFLENATLNNLPFPDIVMKMGLLSTYSYIGIIIDNFQYDKDTTRREVETNRKYPFIQIVKPNMIKSVEYDIQGICKLELYTRDIFSKKNENSYIVWTKEEISRVEKDNITTTANRLGFIPFRFCFEFDMDDSDLIIDNGFEEIAMINRTINNDMSAINNNIHSTCFSSISIPLGQNAKEVKEAWEKPSMTNVKFHEAGGTPVVIQSNLVNIPYILQICEHNINEIYRLAGLNVENKKNFFNQSGASKEYDYNSYKNYLTFRAKQLQETEYWICETVLAYQNKNIRDDEFITYPTEKDFDIQGNAELLKTDLDIISMGISKEISEYAKKQAVSHAYPDIKDNDEETYEKLMESIEKESNESEEINKAKAESFSDNIKREQEPELPE